MRGFFIFILALAAIGLLGAIIWLRIPDLLSNSLGRKFGVPISIDSMHVSSSEISLKELLIGNPRGYQLPKAFSAKTLDVHAPLKQYLKEHIVIDEVHIDTIYLGIEFDSHTSTHGNWSIIFSNAVKEGDLDKKGTSILIKKLVCTNIQTFLLFRSVPGSMKQLPNIDRIELTNISTEGGFPTNQLMASVLGQMLKQVFIQQHIDNMIKGIFQSPSNAIDGFFKPFKGIFNAIPGDEGKVSLRA